MAPVASQPVAVVVQPPPPPTIPAPVPPNDNVAHALAGAGGGVLATVLTYPLITLSTRAQVESRHAASADVSRANGAPSATPSAAPSIVPAKSSVLKAAQAIVAREGVADLYAGLGSAVFGIGVTNFVYYYWYEWTRAVFERRAAARGGASSAATAAGQLSTLESMLAGALAGSATVLLTNPIWVVNTRMMARSNNDCGDSAPGKSAQNKSTLATLLALLREEGPTALFAGVIPALVLVINPILQYTLFEQLKNVVQRRRPVTPGIAFVLGALGKLFATSITYPYITVKSRMHVSRDRQQQQGGVTAALRRVVRDEGYAGLYKGIGPKIAQSVMTAAFLFAFKDVLYTQTVRLRSSVAHKAIKA